MKKKKQDGKGQNMPSHQVNNTPEEAIKTILLKAAAKAGIIFTKKTQIK